jgi:hypothetical protein
MSGQIKRSIHEQTLRSLGFGSPALRAFEFLKLGFKLFELESVVLGDSHREFAFRKQPVIGSYFDGVVPKAGEPFCTESLLLFMPSSDDDPCRRSFSAYWPSSIA